MSNNRQFLLKSAATLILTMPLLAAPALAERVVVKHAVGDHTARQGQKILAKGQGWFAVDMDTSSKGRMRQRQGFKNFEPDPKRYPMAIYNDGSGNPASTQVTPYGYVQAQADQLTLQSGQKVCVIDSGIAGSTGETGGYHSDFDWSVITGTNDSGTGNWNADGGGHGTHVAGTVGAADNGYGVIGMAPGVPMHIIKVFNNSGWGYSSDLAQAAEQCTNAGANIITMSLGGGAANSVEEAAFDTFTANGGLVLAAAGNDGNSSRSFPAGYKSIMMVGANDGDNNIASFSQYPNCTYQGTADDGHCVEISAGGVQTLSTVPTGSGTSYPDFDHYSGTSMATPTVAGVAALVWSNHPTCTGTQIRSALKASAEDSGSNGKDVYFGYGIVKAKDASDYITANGCDGNSGGGGGGDNTLTNGVTETGLSGSTGSETFYTIEVPAGATDLSFEMAGGSGDADMYVRFGSAPTTSTYDCRPYETGNNETCTISNIEAGTYHVMVRAYSTYSSVSLTANYTEDTGGGGSGDGTLTNGVAETNMSGAANSEQFYTIDVPAGATDLNFAMSGGSGDADMYVRFGSAPTTSSYDCRPYKTGNTESCDITTAQAGKYYVMVRGYSAYSGASLTASYTEPSGGNDGGSAALTNLSGAANAWDRYTLAMPAGMSTFTVTITGGTGDADMYVREGSQSTTNAYDCRPYKTGNEETCTFTNPGEGTWYIDLRGYSAYSGMSLNAVWE